MKNKQCKYKLKNNETEENLDFLIGIAKDEYKLFFTRSQTLDAKVVLITTIIGAFLSFTFNIDYIKTLISDIKIYSALELLLYSLLLGIFIAILVLTSNIFMSRKTKFMPLGILDKDTAKNNSIDLKNVVLMTSYKQILEYNDVILKRKNNIFNAICILTILAISIIIVLQFLKVFKI